MNNTISLSLLLLPGLVTSSAQDAANEVPGNWKRSDPLSAIYLPTTESKNDRANQQVVGIVTKKGSHLVTWTMASEECEPD